MVVPFAAPFGKFVAVDSRALLLLTGCAGFKMEFESASGEGGRGISLWEVLGEKGDGERPLLVRRADDALLIGFSRRLLVCIDALCCRVIATGMLRSPTRILLRARILSGGGLGDEVENEK